MHTFAFFWKTSIGGRPYEQLAVDRTSNTFGDDLRAAKAAGVYKIISDALPGTFGESIDGSLADYFSDKVIYLPPIFDDHVVNGFEEKEGRTHQGILLVFDSRELESNSDKKYKQRLAKAVELIQRCLDVEVLDLGV